MSARPTSGAVVDVAAPVVPRLLSVAQAAGVLGVSANVVRDLIDYGKLPAVRLPCARAGDGRRMRRVLVDTRDLDQLIEASRVREFEDLA